MPRRRPVDAALTARAAGEQVEGRQPVRELLRAGRRRVHSVTVADQADVAEILALAAGAGVPVRRVGRDRLDGMALSDAPQGVVARADPLPATALEELAAAPDAFLVVLDGVTDPHNLGAVMRSALGAGATGVVLSLIHI